MPKRPFTLLLMLHVFPLSLLAQGEVDSVMPQRADTMSMVPSASAAGVDTVAVVADPLREARGEAERDSLRRGQQQDDSLRLSRHQAHVLRTAWDAFVASHPLADSLRADTLPLSPVADATAGAPLSEPTFVAWLDSLWTLAATTPGDQMLTYAQPDLRMPVVIEGRPLVAPLDPIDVAASVEPPATWTVEDAGASFARQVDVARRHARLVEDYFVHHPFRPCYVRSRMRKAPERGRLDVRQTLVGSGVDISPYVITFADYRPDKVHADKWHYKGYTSLQMTQTTMSENWYKGGEDNMTLYSDHKLTVSRYDENKKTTFDIIVQVKLGLYYTAADTIHSTRVNENQFLLDVKYGYKAWKNWYYSTQLTFKTPLFNLYSANSHSVKSAFLSPAEGNVSIGMDYKFQNQKKTVTYSLVLAPMAYNLKYVHSSRVDEKKYGIDEGKRALNQYGASLTSKLEWKITQDIRWTSRLYTFTSYESVLGEFENTFTFQVNRYLAANVMVYPRFDDDTDGRVWQMKEMLTFGLNYVW